MAKCSVADYLLKRLKQAGIDHIFGVPGDYNLQFLDNVMKSEDITWMGCANELNAAYAADGYGRQRGAAALLTTYGVGELSAINGIAGSYAEYVPVIHIVGAPGSQMQARGDLIHHTLGDGDYGHFLRMSQEVTAAQSVLTADNAAAEIDRAIRIALEQRRPVYILLPGDVVNVPVTPPHGEISISDPCDGDQLEDFLRAVEEKFKRAKRVAVLADFLAQRWGLKSALHQFTEGLPVSYATLMMGKGLLNERLEGFVGTYSGAGSEPSAREAIESADVVISTGVRFIDAITVGFTQNFAAGQIIELQPGQVSFNGQTWAPVSMAAALEGLYAIAQRYAANWQRDRVQPKAPVAPATQGEMTHAHFWHRLQQFIQPGDIILADLGTAAFGAASLHLPENAQVITQALWSSIGFTLPAAWGVELASPQQRVILVIGDGAAQLTIQELGSMLRDDVHPIIFVLNNGGYTIERAINGNWQRYNDISEWDWTALPQALCRHSTARSWQVSEVTQLDAILPQVASADRLALIEVMLPQEDVPPALQKVAEVIQQRNSG